MHSHTIHKTVQTKIHEAAFLSIKTGLADLEASPCCSSNHDYLQTPTSQKYSIPKKRKSIPYRSISQQDSRPGIVFKLGTDQVKPEYVNYVKMEHLELRDKYRRLGKVGKVPKRQSLSGFDSVASPADSSSSGYGRKKRLKNGGSTAVSVSTAVKRRKVKQVLPLSPPEEFEGLNSNGEDANLIQVPFPMYFKDFSTFQTQALELAKSGKVRYTTKLKNGLTLKVTDDFLCLKFKTTNPKELYKFENFNKEIFRVMLKMNEEIKLSQN